MIPVTGRAAEEGVPERKKAQSSIDGMSKDVQSKVVPSLFTILQNGDLEALKRTLKDKNNIAKINSYDAEGFALLHYAADAGRTEICRDLLKNGADPNI